MHDWRWGLGGLGERERLGFPFSSEPWLLDFPSSVPFPYLCPWQMWLLLVIPWPSSESWAEPWRDEMRTCLCSALRVAWPSLWKVISRGGGSSAPCCVTIVTSWKVSVKLQKFHQLVSETRKWGGLETASAFPPWVMENPCFGVPVVA